MSDPVLARHTESPSPDPADATQGNTAETVLGVTTGALVLAAMYAVFVYVPTDSFQGPVQRIFYIHMAMWLPTFSAFALVAIASLMYLWRRGPGWDRLGRSSAEIGLLFCTLGLATGSIWARPIWGTWWTWDPRLTLTLVLWMIYATYLLLRTLSATPEQGAVLSAILGLSGVIDLYLINRAVYWWRGIHPAVIANREGGSGLADPRMQVTLVICLVSFFLLFVWLLVLRMRTARLQDILEECREALARGPRAARV